jgi:hypothetical protein
MPRNTSHKSPATSKQSPSKQSVRKIKSSQNTYHEPLATPNRPLSKHPTQERVQSLTQPNIYSRLEPQPQNNIKDSVNFDLLFLYAYFFLFNTIGPSIVIGFSLKTGFEGILHIVLSLWIYIIINWFIKEHIKREVSTLKNGLIWAALVWGYVGWTFADAYLNLEFLASVFIAVIGPFFIAGLQYAVLIKFGLGKRF